MKVIELRPINRSSKYQKLIEYLSVNTENEFKKKIFPTIRDLLCFAALLGYSENRRVPFLQGEAKEDIQSNIFQNNPESIDIMFMLALAEEQNLSILELSNMDKAVTIFEEYANGGLGLIEKMIDDHPNDRSGLDAILLSLVELEYIPKRQSNIGDINQIEF